MTIMQYSEKLFYFQLVHKHDLSCIYLLRKYMVESNKFYENDNFDINCAIAQLRYVSVYNIYSYIYVYIQMYILYINICYICMHFV